MRQGVLAGRTAGLRPAERRRLEQICHRRHPAEAVADLLTLQRLAAEVRGLELPLTLVVDGRGLCRLLWVGELEHAARLLEKLPGPSRRQGHNLRLLTCAGAGRQAQLQPTAQEAVVGMDLAPELWLRFGPQPEAGGRWPAAIHTPATSGDRAWQGVLAGDLADLCGQDPAALVSEEAPAAAAPAPTPEGPERVLLLVQTSGDRALNERRIAELEGLVRSAGAVPVGRVEQRRQGPATRNPWGEGKLREAALEARRVGASLVVADRELTPAQARDMESLLDLPISDRSELILDIFAQRAASGAGRLQVELAQLRYRLPRLTGRGLSLSRQGGGIGTRGPGETQLEKDRRAIARRIERLQREVRRLGDHRARLRQGRRDLPRVALVGYTNAGKSSLLNALTGASGDQAVLAEDQLFATLDPTTRRIGRGAAGGGPPLLVTDTVGFIRELPPQLMEAFRSTFEEALDADGLLIVVDLADPAWPEQLATVRTILDALKATMPRRVIGNQIDRCASGELERARALEPGMLFVSATADLGLQHLRQELQSWTAAATTDDPAAVPASAGANFSPMTLQLGDTVPDFTQESQLGPINLYDFAGDSWVVLFSHPADYTPVCTTELGEVSRLRAEWEKRNVKTIALSVDSAESHKGWIGDINETQNTTVDYPILADSDKKVSSLYGMIHPNSLSNLTVRSVFIIDPSKKLRLQITYPASTGRNFDEILRVIDSLQLTDHHQVATPVNWKEGDDCVVVPSIPTDEARAKFPKGVTEIRPYLRMTPQPNK
ncbi:GTP-binding protein HflX [Cyanobium gracile PCC 6307]|uniref:GTPase HflX n=2 Tax=Prochlorococcaceae TaxID=2881426 RepID=K9P832_CYAGP|nr:GTP-binding protein HflX [Cyanobium gracile PCC 6307]